MASELLQVFAVSTWLISWSLAIVGPLLWIYVFLYSKYWHLAVAYALWIFYDRKTSKEGGRRIEMFRKLPSWGWICEYFPSRIIKTAELDPSKNYLLAYHPHGVYSTGLHSNFASEGNNIGKVFPGMKTHFLTLDMNFLIPIFREICLAAGGCSVSRESMNYLLSNGGKGGNAVFLVPGGAREALYSQPNTAILYLKKRKGFIKVAIENGSALVPIYTFGEADIYTQPDNPVGSRLRYFQEKCIDIFGACPISTSGNGILPRRHPMTAVVGAPIPVQKMTNPPAEYVDKVHEEYMTALSDLYYKFRDQYGHPNVELIIH